MVMLMARTPPTAEGMLRDPQDYQNLTQRSDSNYSRAENNSKEEEDTYFENEDGIYEPLEAVLGKTGTNRIL